MSRTSEYYAKNPEAKKKKYAYEKKYQQKPERKEYKKELSKENSKRNSWGDGKDLSHKKGGGFSHESPSKNRARNGSRGGVKPGSKRTGTKK
jgi:hypothetical protein